MYQYEWSVTGYWRAQGFLLKIIIATLAAMAFHAIWIAASRSIRSQIARRRARPILELLGKDRFSTNELLATTKKDSHVARAVRLGIEAFHTAPSWCTQPQLLELADRAISRCERKLWAEMRLGLKPLATITTVAPLVGVLGTIIGILNSFRETGFHPWRGVSGMADEFAQALVPTIFGLAVSVLAVFAYNWLTRSVELLHAQVAQAALGIVQLLKQECRDTREGSAAAEVLSEGLLTGNREAEIPYDRGRFGVPWMPYLWAFSAFLFFLMGLVLLMNLFDSSPGVRDRISYWTPGEFWNDLGWLGRSVALVLAAMLVHVLFVFVTRVVRYQVARWRTRQLRRVVGTDEIAIDGLLEAARRVKGTHVAEVVMAGIAAFDRAPDELANSDAVALAERAMRRCESKVHAEMKLGVNALATIARVAPFVGLLGTAVGLLGAFPEYSGPPSGYRGLVAGSVARALVFAAGSLGVGLLAWWSRNYLGRIVEVLEADAAKAALRTTAYLHGQSREHALVAVSEGFETSGEVAYERAVFFLPYVWMFGLYFAYAIANLPGVPIFLAIVVLPLMVLGGWMSLRQFRRKRVRNMQG